MSSKASFLASNEVLRYDKGAMHTFYTAHTAEETKNIGKKLAEEIFPGTLVCLSGDLGAGKTTFAQGFLGGMGATCPYTSPTFVIMKQYDVPLPTKNGIERIYHVDAYRVETKDFINLGFAEWCADKKGVVILEWPERVKELLLPNRTEIMFNSLSESIREISIIER